MKATHSFCNLSLTKRILFLVTLCGLLSTAVFAQTGHGIITGRAMDRVGSVLIGARVELEPGGNRTATDSLGEFRFIGLAPGSYTVTISYVGFAPFTQQVTVAAGQTQHVDATIQVSAKNEEVTVVADRPHGEAEAINRQRTSDNILQVLPSDVITALPNANIADAVGRLPSVTLERDEGEGKYVQIRGTEPRLNNVTIDGVTVAAPEDNVRQVKLDTIPAGLVESVEVNKTLSPNQDADAIGGTVNLVTKKAGDLPTIQLEAIGGFTPIVNTRYIGQLTGTIGQRFGEQKRFGALFSASYDYNGRGIDDIEPSPNDTAVPSYGSIDLREYRYHRDRWGLGGSLDYRLDNGAGLYLHYFWSDFKDYGDKWVYSPQDNPPPFPVGPANFNAPKFSTSERVPDYGVGDIALGGKHVFTNSWLAWEASAAYSREGGAAGNPGADFQYNGTQTLSDGITPICYNIPAANPHLPQFNPQCATTGSPVYNPANWSLLDINTTSGNTSQVNLQGALSVGKNYHLGSHPSTLEFGFKVRNGHKGQKAYSPTYDNPSANAPLMTSYLSGFTNPNYYFKAYQFGPVTDWNKINSSINSLVSSGALQFDQEATQFASDPTNFDLTERITAGYVMNTTDFGRFRLQAGIRIEATQNNILGFIVTQTQDANQNLHAVTNPSQNNFWYWDPLPVVQLRVRLTADSDLRAVYGRGIARPNPYDLVPYVMEDQTTNPYTITVGNPNLRPEHANNYDVLYEHYLKPYGLVQAGFFYKHLSQPIYYINDPQYMGSQYPQYVGDQFSYIINGNNAHIVGVEASYLQHLGFLPGPLNGFGVSANISWSSSNGGHLPLRNDTPALQRQAPLTGNFSPTYDRGPFSARLGVSYNSRSIYQYQYQSGGSPDLGPKGPVGDIYFYPHAQVDAQASYRVSKAFTVLAQGLNLTNEVFGFYNGSEQYVLQREYYKPTYSFGVRWEPRREY